MRYSINKGKDFIVYRNGSNDTIEIFDIAVMSERRKGYGTQLINKLKQKNKNLFAFMRASNENAKIFYEHNGFKSTFINNFYPDEDAYLMLWLAQ